MNSYIAVGGFSHTWPLISPWCETLNKATGAFHVKHWAPVCSADS